MKSRTRLPFITACSALAIVGALLFSACGEPSTESRPPSPTAAANATAGPGESGAADLCSEVEAAGLAEQIVLRVYGRPMNEPPGFVETQGATHIVYSDGRIMNYGPQAAIAPGFANPSLLTARLTDEGIDAVVAAARDTGLLEERARVIGQPWHGAFTRYEVVLVDDRECHSVVIHAPRYSVGLPPVDPVVSTATETLSQLRYGQLDLNSAAERGLGLAEPVEQYHAERMRVVAIPEEHARFAPYYKSTELAWPLATPIASFAPFEHPSGVARCAVVEGDDMQIFRTALGSSMILDPWVSDGERYILTLRPLWPGESSAAACAVPPGMVAAVCVDGTSRPFPTTMPDALAEVASADLIVTGRVAYLEPARWTTVDGLRPGDCGADPGEARIVTPAAIQIDADPLAGSLDGNPDETFIYALLPGGVSASDQYVPRPTAPLHDDQRVLVSLIRREPLQIYGGSAAWEVRLMLTVADDGMTSDPTGTLPDEALSALTARIQAAAVERVPEPRACEHDVDMGWQTAPHPEGEAHISDVIVTGTVVEVLPAQWTTDDGREPPDSCWTGYGMHQIITPVVIDLDQPVMTHMGGDTPTGRVVVAVMGGSVGESDWTGWGGGPFVAGERVLISLYRQLYLTFDVATAAGTIVWEVNMKFTVTEDGMAVGYPDVYPPEQIDALIARIIAAAATAGPPTPTP